MRKILFFIGLVWLGMGVCMGQTVITQWDFNASNTTPNIGTGTLTNIGSTTNTYASGMGSTNGGQAYNTSNYPAVSSNAQTAGIRLNIATTGYNNITLNFDTRHSSSSCDRILARYSIDNGMTFTTATTFIVSPRNSTSGDNWYNSRTINFGAAINNSANVIIELVTDFYNGSQYQSSQTGTNYGTTGTLRYDAITVKGIATTCTGIPTLQDSGMILTKTDATSMNIAFRSGNGLGRIVVARAGSAVNASPVNGTAYTANASFMSGSQIGTGNYVVANSVTPGFQQFNVTGLTAGVKYYFAIYEYSQTGYCYLTPAHTYAATCNSTVLFPGDMLFVGYDIASEMGGTDKYCIATLVDIKTGTNFSIVNSRYEAGATANARTNNWRGQGNDAYQDPGVLSLTYNGTATITKGSIITLEVDNMAKSIEIDGGGDVTTSFSQNDNIAGNSGFLSAMDPDQIYLVSGYFSLYGTNGVNKYNTLTGNVLCGISNRIAWVPFSNSVSENTTTRESRIPPQINCINIPFTSSSNGFGYIKTSVSHTGTKAQLIGIFTNINNWMYGTGNSNADDIAGGVPAARFTINTANPDGYWNGTANTDWFNCSNWEGLRVPEFATSVTIPGTALLQPEINNANTSYKAAQFEKYAVTDSLKIQDAATVSLKGTSPDRLFTFGTLTIAATGKLEFENTLGALQDTLYLKNHLLNNGIASTSFTAGKGTVFLDQNYSNTATVITSNNTDLSFNNLTLYNTYGAVLNGSTAADINGYFTLANGILTIGNNTFTLKKSATILSPTNSYGETDNGWVGSFVNGLLTRESDNTNPMKFPVGKLVGNIPYFAPCAITPYNTTLKTYSASYFPTTPTDPLNVAGPIDHISQLEYWEINCSAPLNPDKDALITLYWSPYSNVSPGPLTDLRIAHYYNIPKWDLDNPGMATFAITGNLNYGTIKNNSYTTTFSPFTFASISINNVLPIQFLSWQAISQNKKIKLDWQLLDEGEVTTYTIEKSMDGKNFTYMQPIAALHNAGVAAYHTYDVQPANGWNYYRIIVTTKQGKTFTSNTQKAWMGTTNQLLVYPNPASNMITAILPETNASLSLLDANGKKVWGTSKSNQRNITIDVQHLPRGIYVLQYQSLITKSSQKIILK